MVAVLYPLIARCLWGESRCSLLQPRVGYFIGEMSVCRCVSRTVVDEGGQRFVFGYHLGAQYVVDSPSFASRVSILRQ